MLRFKVLFVCLFFASLWSRETKLHLQHTDMTAVTLFSPHFQQDSVALFQKMSNNFINNVLDNEHLNYLIRNRSFGLKTKTRPELHYKVNNMASKFEFALKVKHEKIQTHATNGFSGFKNIGQTRLGVAIRPVQT